MTAPADLVSSFVPILKESLTDPGAGERVRSYFADDGPTFSGRRFETIGGRGDGPEVCNRVTPADLISLATLSVPVPGHAAIDLLEGPVADEVTMLLARVPVDLHIGDPDDRADAIFDDQAPRLYELLNGVSGIGWVSACKLMARKRPHLLPVYDDVIRRALGRPTQFRRPLRECFLHHDIGAAIGEVRSRASVPEEVSDLRVLDVAMWMKHRHDPGSVGGTPDASSRVPEG